MEKHTTTILAAPSQTDPANTDEVLPSQLVQSFEKGETAAFQSFIWRQLALAEHSFGNLASASGASDLLTEKIAPALFNELRNRILSPEFGDWIRKISAKMALEYLRDAVRTRTPEDMQPLGRV